MPNQVKEYELSDLIDATDTNVSSWALYSHSLRRVHLTDDLTKTWINKENVSKDLAKHEQLAQEFFRLIIPHQPETRLVKYPSKTDPSTLSYSVLSEESIGYTRLPPNVHHLFEDGTYTGLGQALAVAMFTEEVDLKIGNIGVNAQHQVIKIDGDYNFGKIRYPDKEFQITFYAINGLPHLMDNYAFNWLDMISEGTRIFGQSAFLPGTVSVKQRFRGEVNQALLRISLIPDCFIDAFVRHYVNEAEKQETFSNFLKSRKQELIRCLLSPGVDSHYAEKGIIIHQYMTSEEAALDMGGFLERMKTMTASNDTIFPKERHLELDLAFNKIKEQLLTDATQKSEQLTEGPSTKSVSSSSASPPKEKTIFYKTRRFFERGCRLKSKVERDSPQLAGSGELDRPTSADTKVRPQVRRSTLWKTTSTPTKLKTTPAQAEKDPFGGLKMPSRVLMSHNEDSDNESLCEVKLR